MVILSLAFAVSAQPNILLEYTFDTAGSVPDSSGNGLNGVIFGATFTMGKVNGAYIFDGIDDKVSVPGTWIPKQKGTVTFWMYLTKANTRQRVLGSHDAFEAVMESGNYLSNQFFRGSSVKGTTVALQQNKWYHVAMTWDNTIKRVTTYIDGSLYDNQAIETGGPINAQLLIGHRTGASGGYFGGKLDELRIYDGVLTQSEVVAVMEGTDRQAAPLAYCTDKEGKVDYTVRGTVETQEASYVDACLNKSVIKEWSCNGAQAVNELFFCQYGCYDGQCLGGEFDYDDDGVLNSNDLDPANTFICRDVDGDSCDDCSIEGKPSQGNDGPDKDKDGICDYTDLIDNSTIVWGACVIRNSYTSSPKGDDPDVGLGYAKIHLEGISDYNTLKTACTPEIYRELMKGYCNSNPNLVQWEVSIYGELAISGCSSSGCGYHECSVEDTNIAGMCLLLDAYSNLPLFGAPDYGTGYAKKLITGVLDYNALKSSCTDSIYDALLVEYCKTNSNPVQKQVVEYAGSGTVGCALSGCDYVSCPVLKAPLPAEPQDSDSDGVPDLNDTAPTNPYACGDVDVDTCEDCSSGSFDIYNDGEDYDADGICNLMDSQPCSAGNLTGGVVGVFGANLGISFIISIVLLTLGVLGGVYYRGYWGSKKK